MKPLVKVVITTSDHKNTIERSIKSVMQQNVTFDFSIHILDNASTDGTSNICKEYAKKYSSMITYTKCSDDAEYNESLYRYLCAIDTEFFTILDGSDYWCDEKKLQTGVDTLHNNPECTLFGHNTELRGFGKTVFVVDEEQGIIKQVCEQFTLNKEKKVPYLHSSSRIYRNIIDLETIEPEAVLWDISLYLLYLEKGYCYYSNHVLSVHEIYANEILTKIQENNQKIIVYSIVKKLQIFFDYSYTKHFSQYFLEKTMDTVKEIESNSSKECVYELLYMLDTITHNSNIAIKMKKNIVESGLIAHYATMLRKKNETKTLNKNNLPVVINTDVLIFDDSFPSQHSPFRYNEYMHYLKHFNNIIIACTGESLYYISNITLSKLLFDFRKEYPLFQDKLKIFSSNDIYKTKLVFVNFLGNAIDFDLGYMRKIPFIINIYPGGRFAINNPEVDEMLERYLQSPYCRKVIVTQRVTYDYLLEKNFCSKDKIEFIYGCILPQQFLDISIKDKQWFGIDKNILDICFVAHKYTPKGEDKGYDTFIEVAKVLSKKYDFIRFHVVGQFNEDVIDVSEIKDKITFYGIQKTDWFIEFYRDKDIILAPNKPFHLMDGAFDGIPTASVLEAGLHEVAMFVTDELQLTKTYFIDKEDIVIIQPAVNDIVSTIEYYLEYPEKLKALGQNAALTIKDLFSYENQIQKRIDIIEKELKRMESSEYLHLRTKELISDNYNNAYQDTHYIPQFLDIIQNNDTILKERDFRELSCNFSKYEQFYDWLVDADSKELLCILLAYKTLGGSTKMKLPLYHPFFWTEYIMLPSYIREKKNIPFITGLMDVYDLSNIGFNLEILSSQLGIFLTFVLKQYEYKDICLVEEGEYVIDGGACFGDTTLYFADLVGPTGKIFAFEPIRDNLAILYENIERNSLHRHKIELIPQPLGEISGEKVRFFNDSAASYISNELEEGQEYETISIDDYVALNQIPKIDFLKLDIEGAEVSAIKGAIKTIQKFKPKLAICVYHKDDDYEVIPKLIKEINPNYTLYLKHNTVTTWETVLFAIDETKDTKFKKHTIGTQQNIPSIQSSVVHNGT